MIQTREDLEAVERMAWHLLIPGPRPEWNNQALAPEGVFLFSGERVADFLADRVRSDGLALARWLSAPRPAGELDAYKVRTALQKADAEARATPAPAGPSRTEVTGEVLEAQERLTELRRRLLARVSSDRASLESTLRVSLEGLRQQLLDQLRPHLARLRIPAHPLAGSAGWLRQTIEGYIARSAQPWHRQLQATLSSPPGLDEMRSELEVFDWEIANRAAARAGRPDTYPDRLARRGLALRDPLAGPDFDPSTGPGPARAPEAGGWGGPTLGQAVRTVAASSAGALLGAMVGLGQVGLAVGALGGALAMQGYEHSTRYLNDLQACEEAGQKLIGRWLDETERLVIGRLNEASAALRQTLQAEFDDLESLLDDERQTAYSAAPDREQGSAERAFLAALHERLVRSAGL